MHLILIILVLFHSLLSGHGFSGNTYVRITPSPRHPVPRSFNEGGSPIELERRLGGHWARIKELVEFSDIQSVVSYHYDNQQCHQHKILARARSTTNCYFNINMDDGCSSDITCSPLQQFYLPEKNCWAPAHGLQVGDVLLTECEGNLPIVHITFIEQQLDLYALKIECPHTFFVGRHSVLTHNMNLPVASLCWELPLTISTLSMAGGLCTGFAMAASGVAVGAITASLIYSAVMEHKAKKYHEVEIPKDTMLLFAQKQDNIPKPPQSGKHNSNQPPDQPQDPNGKKPRCTDKVGNMHELFKREGFGEKLKDASEPTTEIFKGAKVYRMIRDLTEHGLKKGYEFYLDTLHRDHLEIIRNRKQLKVLSLEGRELIDKTCRSIGRTI